MSDLKTAKPFEPKRGPEFKMSMSSKRKKDWGSGACNCPVGTASVSQNKGKYVIVVVNVFNPQKASFLSYVDIFRILKIILIFLNRK